MEFNGSSGQKPKLSFFQRPKMIITIIVILLLIISLFTSTFYVDASEQAVITRFGKYYTTLGEGLHIKLPFGIDDATKVPVTIVQTEQFGFKTIKGAPSNEYKNNILEESSMLTGDLNIVNVEWIIQYRITDPRAWLFTVQQKERTIRDISRSVINSLVGDRAILNVMSNERATIENSALEMMNDNYKKLGLGIKVTTVKLQNIVPPEGVKEAFEDVNKATQDMNRFVNEGKEAYNAQIPKARGEAEKAIQIAQGYATERVNKARGDVARFNSVYEEYRRSPRVTRERLYLETMEEIFGSNDNSTFVDSELENVLPVKNLSKTQNGGN